MPFNRELFSRKGAKAQRRKGNAGTHAPSWRMNLYRVESKPEVAELAWSPTLQNDFHVLPRLGEIVFTDQRVPK